MLIVWIGLALALIATLGACAWMLVRKFMRLLEATADLISTPAILDGVHRAEPEVRELSAILLPRVEVDARYHEQAAYRAQRTLARGEARLDRARALISADAKALN